MHSPALVLAILATLAAAGPTLITYNDNACKNERARHSPSDSGNEQCIPLSSSVHSFRIANEDTGCSGQRAYTYFSVFRGAGCNKTPLASSCFLNCVAVGSGTTVGSYLWDTYSEGVDPPRSEKNQSLEQR